MDAGTAIIVAIITAVSGVIAGLVVAYAKPLAEDRAAALRERRDNRKRHLSLMWDALLDPRNSQRVLPVLASALDDEQLTRHVGRVLAAEGGDEREAALGDARRRLGELMRG
jgi:hypothetical protein